VPAAPAPRETSREGAGQVPLTYDLRQVNTDLDRSKRRTAMISTGFVAVLIAVSVVLAVSLAPKAARGSITAYQMIVLVGGIVWIAVIVGIVLRGLRWRKPGAEAIKIDDRGIEISFPDPRIDNLWWADRSLRIVLQDYSGPGSGNVSVLTRHLLLASGRETVLTSEEFRAILNEVDKLGLLHDSHSSGFWETSAPAQIHVVVGGRAS